VNRHRNPSVGIYRHFKHTSWRPRYYLVLPRWLWQHNADDEPMVRYISLYPSDRPRGGDQTRYVHEKALDHFLGSSPINQYGLRYHPVGWHKLLVVLVMWPVQWAANRRSTAARET
jgi:hypothetical protein